MYMATMWSYLSGFFVLMYLVAPPLYLFFGWLPITAFSFDFFVRIIPYLVANQLLFVAFGWGLKTWRGQQNSLAMWPLWVGALVTSVRNVYFGTPLRFVVTPKTRLHGGALRERLRLVRLQMVSIVALACAALWGLLRLTLGLTVTRSPSSSTSPGSRMTWQCSAPCSLPRRSSTARDHWPPNRRRRRNSKAPRPRMVACWAPLDDQRTARPVECWRALRAAIRASAVPFLPQ
jgi:hypothetical protein